MSASEIKNVDLRLLSNAMCERKTKKLTVVLEIILLHVLKQNVSIYY